jgi:hypothetical protein
MDTLRRVVWLLKLPLQVILELPALPLEFVYCLFSWIFTGDDGLLDDHSPLGWLTTGWRWKVFVWPIKNWEE